MEKIYYVYYTTKTGKWMRFFATRNKQRQFLKSEIDSFLSYQAGVSYPDCGIQLNHPLMMVTKVG